MRLNIGPKKEEVPPLGERGKRDSGEHTGAGPISEFLREHYQGYNAAIVVEAAEAWCELEKKGGTMFVTLAGAMSTAQLGKSLACLIREGFVCGISCTGANLEEDLFNLVGFNSYVYLPGYQDLTPDDEAKLRDSGLNRVTDAAIPDTEAVAPVAKAVRAEWLKADRAGEREFPHEFLYRVIRSGVLEKKYEANPADSWLLAAAEKNLPIVVPGWEDSTLGNVYAAMLCEGKIKNAGTVKSGLEYMVQLTTWYRAWSKKGEVGFFQIGGGIAGDFPICVVPMLHEELKEKVKRWAYFCQITDADVSYGGYSGAVPNEKITWGKLEAGNPSFVIKSDATIVAPLIFAIVLGW